HLVVDRDEGSYLTAQYFTVVELTRLTLCRHGTIHPGAQTDLRDHGVGFIPIEDVGDVQQFLHIELVEDDGDGGTGGQVFATGGHSADVADRRSDRRQVGRGRDVFGDGTHAVGHLCALEVHTGFTQVQPLEVVGDVRASFDRHFLAQGVLVTGGRRSEERRVGKDWRLRCARV